VKPSEIQNRTGLIIRTSCTPVLSLGRITHFTLDENDIACEIACGMNVSRPPDTSGRLHASRNMNLAENSSANSLIPSGPTRRP
jgi:hypothetical protein